MTLDKFSIYILGLFSPSSNSGGCSNSKQISFSVLTHFLTRCTVWRRIDPGWGLNWSVGLYVQREGSPGRREGHMTFLTLPLAPSPSLPWPRPGLRAVAPARALYALWTHLELPRKDLAVAGLVQILPGLGPGTAGLPPNPQPRQYSTPPPQCVSKPPRAGVLPPLQPLEATPYSSSHTSPSPALAAQKSTFGLRRR